MISTHSTSKKFRHEQEGNNSAYMSPNKQNRISSSQEFKEQLRQDQKDLKQKLKYSLNQYEQQIKQEQEDDQIHEKEIRIGQQLKNKCKAQNIIITKLCLIVDDGVYRCKSYINQLLKLADSGEANALLTKTKQQIELMVSQVQQLDQEGLSERDISLEDEFARQRNQYMIQIEEVKEKSKQLEKSTMKQLESLISQNKHFQETINFLERQNDEQHETRQKDMKQHSNQIKIYEEEINKYNKALQEQDYKFSEVTQQSELKNQKIEFVVQQIGENQKNVEYFEQQIKQTEQENQQIRKILNDLENEYQKQKNLIKAIMNENQMIKTENDTYKKEILKIESDVKIMTKSREHLELVAEQEIKQFKLILEDQKVNFKDQIQKLQQSENSLEAQQKFYESKLINLQDLNYNLKQILEKKELDLNQLFQTQHELEDFSRKQIDLIRDQEDKLNKYTDASQMILFKLTQINDLKIFQCINHNYSEDSDRFIPNIQSNQNVQTTAGEIELLRNQLEKMINNFHFLTKWLEQLEQKNITLMEANQEFQKEDIKLQDHQERFKKLNEILVILREENKSLKLQLDEKNQGIKLQDQEISNIKTQFNQLSEIVKSLNHQLYDIESDKSNPPGIESTIEILQHRIHSGDQEITMLRSECSRLEQKFISYKDTNDNELQRNEQIYKSQIENYQKQISLLKRDVRNLENLLDTERTMYNQEMTGQIKKQINQLNHQNQENIKRVL